MMNHSWINLIAFVLVVYPCLLEGSHGATGMGNIFDVVLFVYSCFLESLGDAILFGEMFGTSYLDYQPPKSFAPMIVFGFIFLILIVITSYQRGHYKKWIA
jgi:hypothetical protein